jgi:polyisoprenoid-binding protein YceI
MIVVLSSISRSKEDDMSTVVEISSEALPLGTWHADAVHSHVGFAIEYNGGTFRGTFSPFAATLVVDEDGGATLSGTAPVAGVHVQDENLTAHLQSPDFFDAERAPELRFASRSIFRSGRDVTVAGELTIRGATQPVELRGTVGEPLVDAYGRDRFALELAGSIDRTQFGIDWNLPLPDGRPALANEVELTAELFFVKE